MITITLLNNGKDRYTMSSNSFYLGRKYDDNAQEYQVIFPQEEIDAGHTCKMIVTACNGSIPVDTIPMSSGVTKLIRSNLSQYDRIEIGFTFEGENNYRKNSEIRYFYFYDAQMPDGFIPATPEINTIVDEAFCGVQWKDGVDNTLQFTNLAGEVKDEINLGEFVQEQSDLAETDDTKETFVKNKSTKYLENEGEDGTSPYATVQYVNDEDDGLQSQIDVVNDNITNLENKVADALDDISTIDTAINKNVVSGIGVSTNVDNVSINSNIVNIKTGATSTDTDAIPLANDTTAGLISHSDYQQIRQNTEDIAVLKGQTIRIAYSVKPNPTAQEINDFVVAQGYTQDQFPQIAVVVTGTNYVWRYYANDGWTQQTDVVSIFTNDTAGIIKGSTASGKIYAETDGTGSVNGWDAQNNRITNLENNKADKSELDDYQPLIDSNHKISSDLVDDTNKTNKFVTTAEKNTWNGKQGALSPTQLNAVNSGIDDTKVAQIATNTTNIALKADKVTNATNGNFAGLDANGNLTDSGKKASDFSKVEVSATGTATDEIGYITVDGVEKKLAGGEPIAEAIRDNTTQISYSDSGSAPSFYAGGANVSNHPGGSVIVGNRAKITNDAYYGVVIGDDAEGHDRYGVAIGMYAKYKGASVSVGRNADTSQGSFRAAIGGNCNAYGEAAIAIGYGAFARGIRSIAIGSDASDSSGLSVVYADDAILLGKGKNSTANTFQIFNDNIYNHSTHTLTVQNISLNGTDINTVIDNKISAAVTTALSASY